ncbi:MAG: MBL fold metallo-hydrolase [Verrucomicrobiae bacterium]|nr:MBL fold metallo-hydrolase [Verrucomicrobiae bacterium]MCB1091332.1 MBL fold metallo-hydrolase [Verrucomicrobiae bacterium]
MSESRHSIPVEMREGHVFLPEVGLWLDPHRRKDLAFVSHAHSDHFGPHRELICSEGTRVLIEERYRPKRTTFRSVAFHEEILLNGHRLKLLPAGHIAGSAQLFVERLADGASLLYTGDFKLRAGHAAEVSEWCRADTLIMETTFGLPRYQLPPGEEIVAEMVAFARKSFEDGHFPVFLAYSLGKAQEALLALHRSASDFAFCLHPAAARMTEAVATLGYEFPPFHEFDPDDAEFDPSGWVHIQPPMAKRQANSPAWSRARVAMITGWALDKSARYRFRVDEAFALSDHADYDDLLRCVEERVKPRRILTLHGYAKEFAADLRRRGWEAWSLGGGDQLELGLFTEARREE